MSSLLENPLKTAREYLHLSQDQIVERSGVSKTAVVRAEQGCYVNIPVGLLKFYASELPSIDGFSRAYELYKTLVRKANYGRLYYTAIKVDLTKLTSEPQTMPRRPIEEAIDDFPVSMNPFTQWREFSNLNKAQVSKYFCVPLSTINKLENKQAPPNSMPGVLTDALLESGYSNYVINALNRALVKHKNYIVRSARSVSVN